MNVGWYVHHHGTGHRSRLRAVCAVLPGVTALGSAPPADPPCPWVPLADDRSDDPVDPTAHGTLHWVPAGHPGLRERMAQLAAWIAAERPDVLVVDVSVEVALLGRLLGVPTVLIAQRGRRLDPPHRLVCEQAAAVAVPWTAVTDLPGDLPDDARRVFCGAVSRLDGCAFGAAGDDVLVLIGSGGHEVDGPTIAAAAASTPARTWHVAGPVRAEGVNVVDHGGRADVAALLDRCGTVVGTAGGNVVAEVAAARRAFVCLPQQRPFAEQARTGEALRRLGVAEVLERWPHPRAWPTVLEAAEARDRDRWGELHDGHGAERIAEVVTAVAQAGGARAPGLPFERAAEPAAAR